MPKILIVFGRDLSGFGKLLTDALIKHGLDVKSYDHWSLQFRLSTPIVEIVGRALDDFDYIVCIDSPDLMTHQVKKYLELEAKLASKHIGCQTKDLEKAVTEIVAVL